MRRLVESVPNKRDNITSTNEQLSGVKEVVELGSREDVSHCKDILHDNLCLASCLAGFISPCLTQSGTL